MKATVETGAQAPFANLLSGAWGGWPVAVRKPPAKARKPREPTPPWKIGVLLGGIAAIVVGCILFYVGLKPLEPLMGLFTQGMKEPTPAQKEFMDNLNGHLSNAAVPVGIGMVLLLGGFILIKVGLSGPKPKSVEQVVEEKVAERMSRMGVAAQPPAYASPVARPGVGPPRVGALPAPGPRPPATVAGAARLRACSHCRRPLQPHDAFCVYCGTSA
jgi:hypothetical protein